MTTSSPKPDDPAIVRMREADLADLRWHWGEAYAIWYQAGQFCAARRDTGAICRRPEADALHRAIIEDYHARPVPR
ncbi:MAG: hypothetical protein ACHP9Z_06585 [Streptosporangiales bacterium]